VPGHLFNAPVAGSGKTLLMNTAVMMYSGSTACVLPPSLTRIIHGAV
jgi:hypothetical protein